MMGAGKSTLSSGGVKPVAGGAGGVMPAECKDEVLEVNWPVRERGAAD